MIKKLILFIATLSLVSSVYAATATPAATTTKEATPDAKQKLDDLKDRLATKVAQLRQSQKRAIFGTVKTISVSTITVETKTSDVKIELTDTIKVFQTIKDKRTALTTDDLSKGDAVVVFGDYDANLDLLKAKVIFIQDNPLTRVSGAITAIDKKNFTLTITTREGQSYVIDIQTLTKNFLWDKNEGMQKGAFSKYAIGDTIFALGTPEAKKENWISPVRVLDIGNLSGVTPTPTPVVTHEASSSATPTTKSTPKTTPTLKVTPKTTPTP